MAVIQDRDISHEKLENEIELIKQKLGPEVSSAGNIADLPSHAKMIAVS